MEEEPGHPRREDASWVNTSELLRIWNVKIKRRVKKALGADFGVVWKRTRDAES